MLSLLWAPYSGKSNYHPRPRLRRYVPSAPYVRLKLLLARTHPRRVMLLSHLNAAVTEHHGNAVHRYAGLEQLDRESVPEAVRVAVWNPRQPKHGL